MIFDFVRAGMTEHPDNGEFSGSSSDRAVVLLHMQRLISDRDMGAQVVNFDLGCLIAATRAEFPVVVN